jgi:hypothetical protein
MIVNSFHGYCSQAILITGSMTGRPGVTGPANRPCIQNNYCFSTGFPDRRVRWAKEHKRGDFQGRGQMGNAAVVADKQLTGSKGPRHVRQSLILQHPVFKRQAKGFFRRPQDPENFVSALMQAFPQFTKSFKGPVFAFAAAARVQGDCFFKC